MPSRGLTARTTAGERRWLAALCVAALIPFALLAFWAHATLASLWEQQIVDALALGNNLPGDLVVALNTLGNLRDWAVFVILVAVAVGLLRGVRAGVLVGASFFVDLLASLAKDWVERGRPDTAAAHLLFGVDSFGFPSGHAARAAAFVGALIWVFAPPRWRLPLSAVGAVLGGLVMAYARVALGVHFPSDVIGGLLLGLAWFAATAALI